MKTIMTFWLSAIAAALFLTEPLCGADGVFLKPLGEGETRATMNGASWSTAYASVADAVTAANGEKPVYAAQGVYVISATVTVSTPTTIYGGFPGLSDDETLEDRDIETCQTIFTGDRSLDDVWIHSTPNEGAYSVSSATLAETVIVGGKVSPPPAYEGDYDCYYPSFKTTNTSTGFSVANGLTVDGIWFTGFIPSGNNGSVIEMKGGALDIFNCRFVGIKGGARASLHYNTAGGGVIRDSKFLWVTSSECATFRHSNASSDLVVSNCVFESSFRSGGNTGGNVFYGRDRTRLQDCVFARCVDVTTQAGNGYGGMGNLVGGDGSNPVFLGCVITNNFSASAGQYGNPLIARGRLIKGGLIANNRYQVKPIAGRGYALIGYASAGSTLHFVCDGVTFRGNQVIAPQTAASSGAYYLGLLGQNVVSSGNGQPFSLVNCVFDSNVAASMHDAVTGVTPFLCRGPYSLGVVSGAKSQIGIANCTFTGPFAEGVFDVAQFGTGYGYDVNIVNSIFTVTDADIAANWVYADTPSRVKAYSCSVKNLPDAPASFGVCSLLETDDVPLDAAYVPQANVPNLRVTADVSTNALPTGTAAPTFAFRPNGSESWGALVPQVATAIAHNDLPIGDKGDVARPLGAFTRGAVQPLAAVAETGVTLTLRRSPLASGSFGDSPNAQTVASGASVAPVTALPRSEQISFAGWYGEDGTLYSAANPLAIPSLTGDLVLTARFKAAGVMLTFDLGQCGKFTENGASTISIAAEYLTDFPAIPAFQLDDGVVLVGWGDLPAKVPAVNTTYVAKFVTSEVRVIHLTPEGAGRRDGTDWENAYGDFAAAYADAAAYRGEVWISRGVYTLAGPVGLRANVAIRGGFTGTETSAEEADPEVNPVIFSGDANGDDYWLVNGSSPPADSRTPVLADDAVNSPNPDGSDTYWAPGGNVADNLKFGFVHSDLSVTNVLFSGVTLASFETTAFSSSTLGGGGVRFEDCRFVANNGGHYGDDQSSDDYDKGGVYVSGTSVAFERCVFEGNFWAVGLTAPESSSCRFAECAFIGNFGGAKAATVRIRGKMGVSFEGCRFYRNCNNNEKHESATCVVFSGGEPCRLSDCVFEDNRSRGNSHGAFLGYGSSAAAGGHVFERCQFIGNTSSIGGSYNAASALFAGYSANDAFLIRDCHFSGNTIDTTTGKDAYFSAILSNYNGDWTFLNCTFEANGLTAPQAAAKGAVFNALGGRLALVNCSVIDSILTGEGSLAEFRIANCGGSLAIINSAIGNKGDVYAPFLVEAGTPMKVGVANSVIRDFDATLLPTTENSYVYATTDAAPRFLARAETGANGAVARGLSSSSPNVHDGLPVWLDGTTVYFKDDVANPGKPRRKAIDVTSFAAAMPTLDESALLIPDAFGRARNPRRFAMGPLVISAEALMFWIR